MIHWQEVKLWDSAGSQPDVERHAKCMREFRDTGCISDYWCNDPNVGEETAEGKVWDEYNEEYRYPEDVGPSVEEIDFSGLD